MPSRRASSNSGCVSGPGIDGLVEVVELGDVVDEPAREERRQRQLGEHDEVAAPVGRLGQQREQPLDDVLAGVGALDRAELGRTDGQHGGVTRDHPGTGPRRGRRVVGVGGPCGTVGAACWRWTASSARTARSRALDGMTFTVEPGSVTGFLGPNGAGKTTTMRAVFGLTALDAGERALRRPADRPRRCAAASATCPRSAACTRRCGSPSSSASSASCAAWTARSADREARALARASSASPTASTTSSRTSRSATSSACS